MRTDPATVRRIVVPPRPRQAPRYLVVVNPYEVGVDVALLEPELVTFLTRLDDA